MRKAILDLGTNTFHLLIVEVYDERRFTELHRERRFIKLAEGGIAVIGEEAWQRGLKALQNFQQTILQFEVASTIAIGTAAIRTASNGPAFLRDISNKIGIQVQVIDGQVEADLIYRGVRQVWDQSHLPALIMDIGGGSVEFIIGVAEQRIWAQSFPIGVAVLYHHFHRSDPISSEDIDEMTAFLKPHLDNLNRALLQYRPLTLIGASGTFDVLQNLVNGSGDSLYTEVEVTEIARHIDHIQGLNRAARLRHPQIPSTRVDMIVVAVLLIQEVLSRYPFNFMAISKYALKEGLIFLD